MNDHLLYLEIVLKLLQQHHLYAKITKCKFGCYEIEYLGHVISSQGVQADSTKISRMLRWSVPTSIKALEGFLGLTRYCHKFIIYYGCIATPSQCYYARMFFTGIT